ncbi:Bro-N domain-containing protein [Desulfovibrio desulfuricans]|nr:Bro-N domain-containing protein [Desulfovibrio desulfuricans]
MFMPEIIVRVVCDENGEPLFVAKDVSLALGYQWNGAACINHVPEEWRGVRSILTPSGTQEMLTLSEQGLYFFLGRSDKPKALPFQKWLAGEVLPTIRRTGAYNLGHKGVETDSTPSQQPFELPDFVKLIGGRARERYMLQAIQIARISGITDKAGVYDIFLDMCRTFSAPAQKPPFEGMKGRGYNSTKSFVEQFCEVKQNQCIFVNSLYATYENWLDTNNIAGDRPSRQAFMEQIEKLVPAARVDRPRYGYGRMWRVVGIGLNTAARPYQ